MAAEWKEHRWEERRQDPLCPPRDLLPVTSRPKPQSLRLIKKDIFIANRSLCSMKANTMGEVFGKEQTLRGRLLWAV